jgi:hypothetical protein
VLRACLIKRHIVPAQPVSFLIGDDFMLPVNCGSHADYQNFVVENLRKYYPDPDALSRATWDIIDHFGNLGLSYTDEWMRSKYSRFGSNPRTPFVMQRSYLFSINFNVTSISDNVTPVVTSVSERKHRVCDYASK